MYFDSFVGLQFFMCLLFASPYLLAMSEIPPLNHFSINKYMSMSEIFYNSIPVTLNIASQLNSGKLKE